MQNLQPRFSIRDGEREVSFMNVTSPQSDEPIGDTTGLLHCRGYVVVAVCHGGRVLDE